MLRAMEDALHAGVEPSRIAFVSFTRAAVGEARRRAMERFGATERELVYFRTVHSLAFRELGLRRADVVGEGHLAELAEVTGELVAAAAVSADGEATATGRLNADALMTLDHYARTTGRGLEGAWRGHGHDGDVGWYRLLRFSEAYGLYKRDRGLVDFTDMLTEYADSRLPPAPLDVAIIDEAQDLTAAQWRVVDRAFAEARQLWVAGDDDQSIHAWAGADDERFLGLPHVREVLPLSHRLPRAVFDLAAGVIGQVGRRYAKAWGPAARAGSVEWIADPAEVDLSSGTWLLLARTRAQMAELAAVARDQGVVYAVKGSASVDPKEVGAIVAYEALRAGRRVEGYDARDALVAMGVPRELDERTYTAAELGVDVRPIWHDALVRIHVDRREYYLSCLRRGESLTREPRVHVDTVHGSKGREAENVLLPLDMTWGTWRGYELDPDAEARVFYVGVTRASQALWLVAPRGAYGYPMP